MIKLITLINHTNCFLRKLRDDNVAAFSAQAAFFIIISFFPFIMFLLTLIQYLPFSQISVMEFIKELFPQGTRSYVFSIITEIYNKASGTLISVTAITALWSASKGILALIRGLNSVYGIKETRNYIHLRIISTFYTLIFAVMLIITMALLLFGNSLLLWIEQKLPQLKELALFLISLRTFFLLCILVLFFLVMFLFIPNRKSHFFTEVPGAILTAAGWMGFSYLYSFYIENMSNFSYMYGSLTAIVLLMLWLYACMYIMLIGGKINLLISQRQKQEKVC